MRQIVLVRPWRDAAVGGGCCSAGPDSVCLEDPENAGGGQHGHPRGDVFAETYRLLRERLPEVDVQMVASNNTVFLLPSSYRAARHNHGRMQSLRRAMASTTAGAVLVDGQILGHVESLGADAVLRRITASAGGATG